MLHESIRDQNEEARNPAPESNPQRSQEVITGPQALFAPDERADECAFQEESEHAFHRQRLSNYPARIPGKARPVRPKLKFHGNAGDHAHSKVQAEYLGPKPYSFVVLFITRLQRSPFPIDDKPRQSHRELWVQIVISECEAELKAAPERRIRKIRVHLSPLHGEASKEHIGVVCSLRSCAER